MFSLDWASGGSNHAHAGSFGGYLYKLKRKQKMVLSQWNRRFFSIEGKNLTWYENENTKTPSGHVDLRQVTDINEFQAGQCSFVIKCSERNLMLRAQNTSDMEKWLRILRQSTSYAQGGNGTSCDFSKTGAGAGARAKAASSKACNSLASELDKALDGLNRLEADAMEKEHEAVRMDISNRINANANASIAAAGARESFAPVRPEGGQIIRSSDSEICIGKMHAPLPNEHNNKNVHNNTQFSSDQEIVVGKTSPISPNNEMNNSSISYFGDDDDGADDGVVEFDELPDEEEFRYQEKLLAEKYGSELISKGDQVSSATATGTESRDAKVDRRQTPPASMSVSRAECKRKDWDSGRLDSKGYESK